MKNKKASKPAVVYITENFESMLIYAERYACGRRSYSVGLAADYITAILPLLSDNTLHVMDEDMKIMQRFETNSGDSRVWGDECDKKRWEQFWVDVKAEIIRRNVAGGDEVI